MPHLTSHANEAFARSVGSLYATLTPRDAGPGAPVVVDGRIRAGVLVGSIVAQSLPPGTEDRVNDFADLVATAIYNAENRAELKASRARIVAASDQARRRSYSRRTTTSPICSLTSMR